MFLCGVTHSAIFNASLCLFFTLILLFYYFIPLFLYPNSVLFILVHSFCTLIILFHLFIPLFSCFIPFYLFVITLFLSFFCSMVSVCSADGVTRGDIYNILIFRWLYFYFVGSFTEIAFSLKPYFDSPR